MADESCFYKINVIYYNLALDFVVSITDSQFYNVITPES